ncbi:MAG: ribulose-phosphate 3-epimerase [Clostridia bacterium]|nr:ribulose-phosphate 3-epimerase [Clostridia bacterium]
MKKLLSASVMCTDLMNFSKSVKQLEEAGIDYLHVDIMDGSFVPNMTFGFDFVNALKAITDIPLDVHMMVNDPARFIDRMKLDENDILCVHYEADIHIHRALAQIKDKGVKAGIAINPHTRPENLEYLMDNTDMVLVMTVNPGFAGQKIIGCAEEKTKHTRKLLDDWGYSNVPIEVDGNINPVNAEKLSKSGAEIFVLGTSGLFLKDKSIKQAAEDLRKLL